MQALLLVMIGGSLGAGARHLVGRLALTTLGPGYPWGTLMVNLIGGLAMGVLVGGLVRHPQQGETLRLLLGVGVLGGFTTFSAFALDIVTMAERGALAMALGYALLSVVGAVLALFAGLSAARALA